MPAQSNNLHCKLCGIIVNNYQSLAGHLWHNREKDEKRNEYLLINGWKILRYIKYIPTERELNSHLNELEHSKSMRIKGGD